MRPAGALFALIALAVASDAFADARIDREIARLEAALDAVDTYSVLATGLIALGAHVNRAILRVLQAIAGLQNEETRQPSR